MKKSITQDNTGKTEREFEYPAIIISGYGGGKLWVANFVGLTSCWVEGEDRDDVIRRAPSVLAEYVKDCIGMHWPVPDPPSVDELRETGLGEVMLIRCRI